MVTRHTAAEDRARQVAVWARDRGMSVSEYIWYAAQTYERLSNYHATMQKLCEANRPTSLEVHDE